MLVATRAETVVYGDDGRRRLVRFAQDWLPASTVNIHLVLFSSTERQLCRLECGLSGKGWVYAE